MISIKLITESRANGNEPRIVALTSHHQPYSLLVIELSLLDRRAADSSEFVS